MQEYILHVSQFENYVGDTVIGNRTSKLELLLLLALFSLKVMFFTTIDKNMFRPRK